VNCVLAKFSLTAYLTDLAGWSSQNKRQIMRKIKNTRIFTWKTLCPTKVKNHDLPPVEFSLFTIPGKHGYNVTHPIMSNSHSNVQHLWTLTHILVSPRPGHKTHSSKEWIFLPYYKRFYYKQIVRTIKALIFLPRLWIIQSYSQRIRFFSIWKLTQFSQYQKPNVSPILFVCHKTKHFLFLFINNFEQIQFQHEKETKQENH